MSTIEQQQEKKNRKRKYEDINIEHEDKELNNEQKEYNDNNNFNHTIKSEYDLQAKLEICKYSETTNITNAWKISKYFQYKYPLLREEVVKRWIKKGSNYFEEQINQKGGKTKRVRKQTQGHFQKLELMLIDEIVERAKHGYIRDIQWARNQAIELHNLYKQQFNNNIVTIITI